MSRSASLGIVLLSGILAAARGQEPGAASPHDGHHLVVLRSDSFRAADGETAATIPDRAAAFGRRVGLTEPLAARLNVRFEGKYQIWLRTATAEGKPAAVEFDLRKGTSSVKRGVFGKTSDADHGGPAAYEVYAKAAAKTGLRGKLEKFAVAPDPKRTALNKIGGDLSDIEAELLDELKPKKERNQAKWVTHARVEAVDPQRPAYWWKLTTATLKPGDYELRLKANAAKSAQLSFDVGFLTTSQEIAYPFRGDIDAAPASFVRFRIAEAGDGVSINAGLRIHSAPWSTPRVWLNPAGMATAAQAHTAAGFTRWYRLQDIENTPGFGNAQAHLLLSVSAGKNQAKPRGATQFAVFPHDDYVLREIDWSDPEGLRISMAMDFASNLHLLRTLRDHARENYERALAATGGQVFPLTRGELYFGNAWGAASGPPAQYMVKTLRLLGFNCVGDASDPIVNRELYGWNSHAGHYWPPAMLPYDEDAVRKKYDAYYRDYFSRRRDYYEGVTVFQMADEPGEISREAMSSPLWRFAKEEEGEKYADASGGSTLSTRKTDYSNCVLEGKIEKHGQWIGLRVAQDNAANPRRYAEWRIGQVSQDRSINLAATRRGIKPEGTAAVRRPSAVVGAGPTPFRIVYEGDSAEMYVHGKRVHQFTGLPRRGGFAFVGPAKAVCELRFRPIRKDEHIVNDQPEVKLSDAGKKPDPLKDFDVDGFLADGKTPAWAKPKPLRKMIAEDWVIGGGIPAAHAGFRAWAKKQGLSPATFGKRSWDDVRMLTVASLVESKEDARLYYWSRRYSGYLTPRMFSLATEAAARHAPNKSMKSFVALSGHALYFPSAMPLDMFQLASAGGSLMPGVSDWMSTGGWRWDSHQAVAYSVAMYNAGARRPGAEPLSYPMMHCVWPSEFRAYTMLANQVRYLSYYNYGPFYAVTEGFWSESPGSYHAVHRTNNRAAQIDDVLAKARMRPSRVAMLYSISNEYWNPQTSFADKRASFLALSHEYFQPELVTEDQVLDGALENYDALYVLDPIVAAGVQERIGGWVNTGGLLWTCADAATRNEFNEPQDLLAGLAGVRRTFAKAGDDADARLTFSPVAGGPKFRGHAVARAGIPRSVAADGAKVLGQYGDSRPAWIERTVESGKVVYVAHRAGLTYTSLAARRGGYPTIWADTGRAPLTAPLVAAKIERPLVLSEPTVMASPLDSPDGSTVVVLYNMRPVASENVRVSLAAPAAPESVQRFEGHELVDLPFEYRDGRVEMTLPQLSGGQMIVLRRAPAAPDGRLAKLRARTESQLQSSDWRALSAGAWFAGYQPTWNLAPRVVPLLRHKHWEVRRAAAEALGRLQHADAANDILSAAAAETDAHALGDQILALGRLGDPRVEKLAVEHLAHRDAFVRSQAMAAALAYVDRASPSASAPREPGLTKFALAAAQTGLQDLDLRVRGKAIDLASRYDPQFALQSALAAFSDGSNDPDRLRWAAALAANDGALALYAKQGFPGGGELLLAVASRRKSPEIAAALSTRAGSVDKGNAQAWIRAAIAQRSDALTRALFDHRADLPPAITTYLPVILEKTYDARLGGVMADWENYLQR